MMAQIKTPYGLVYNTDGSLCTTYRDDDIPFPGVRSFAVENVTTNYINFPLSVTQVPSWLSYEFLDEYTMKVTILDATQAEYGYYCIFNSSNTGSTLPYTMSAELAERTTPGLEIGITGFGSIETTSPVNLNLGKIGDRYFRTIQYASGWKYQIGVRINLDFSFKNGDYIIIRKPQIEEKPYPTSFVVGSRPAPALQFRPLPRETVNIGGTDWQVFTNTVISFWFKVPRVQDADLNTTDSYPDARQYAIFTNERNIVYDWLLGQFTLGIQRNTGNLRARIANYNTVFTVPIETRGNYEDSWHMFTFCKYFENNTFYIKCYYDGETVHNSIGQLTSNSMSYMHDDIFFYNYYKRSNLISNIFIGKNRKPDGTVIWTDDYIREVYEAQMPFAVQNQLSIY